MSLQEKLKIAYALAERESAASWLSHLQHLVVDSRPEPARFVQAARAWQWAWARETSSCLEHYAGLRPANGPRFFWRTLARGHDKTTGLGRIVNWLLRFGTRPLVIHAAAADRDQAALLLDAMRREADLNPWLKAGLEFRKDGASGPRGSILEILTSDAPTAAGARPDVVICDEITHWQKRDLWDMLWTGVPKRGAAVFVITNAGVKHSWQWDLKEAAKRDAQWSIYEAPGRLDTWMSEAEIRANEKLCTPSEARRLWRNEWLDPAEEAGYLLRADLEACEQLGRDRGAWGPALKGVPGLEYWAGIDYGPKRDRTALSVMHQEADGLAVLDSLDVWQGSPATPVPLSGVREWIDAKRESFPGLSLIVDPYQMEDIVQDYQRRMRCERWEARGGKGNYEMAELVRSLVVNRRLVLYPEAGLLTREDGTREALLDEIAALVIKRMPYGYRVDHENTKHDDRFVALGMPLVAMLGGLLPSQFKKPPVLPQTGVSSPETRVSHAVDSSRNPKFVRFVERGLYGTKR